MCLFNFWMQRGKYHTITQIPSLFKSKNFSYVDSLNDSYGTVIAFQVVASALSIVLALFSIIAVEMQVICPFKINIYHSFQNDWGGGYGFVVFSFTAIFSFCFMGTMVNNQVELTI